MSGRKFVTRFRLLAAGAVVAVGALSAAAMAQAPDWRMFHHHGGPGMESPAMHQLRLAQRLAGLEVYLAITPEQQPQWRAFTAALLAMVPDLQPPAGDAFAAIDQITAKVQAMAQPAQHLHDSADALKAVLTADQIGRANALWVTMREHGMGRRHGPMGDPPGGPMAPGAGGPPPISNP